MKHTEKFKEWLPEHGVKSTASYKTYINAVEAVFDDVDKLFDELIQEGIEKKITEKRFNKPMKDVQNYKSALKKYWEFLNDKG